MEKVEAVFIAKGPDTRKLYQLEEKATAAVKAAATEYVEVWQKLAGSPCHLYDDAIPQTLAMLCDAFGKGFSLYLEEWPTPLPGVLPLELRGAE